MSHCSGHVRTEDPPTSRDEPASADQEHGVDPLASSTAKGPGELNVPSEASTLCLASLEAMVQRIVARALDDRRSSGRSSTSERVNDIDRWLQRSRHDESEAAAAMAAAPRSPVAGPSRRGSQADYSGAPARPRPKIDATSRPSATEEAALAGMHRGTDGQHVLEERLRRIEMEEAEKRRLAQHVPPLSSPSHFPYRSGQPAPNHSVPGTNHVTWGVGDNTVYGAAQNYSTSYPLLNQSQISARHCTSKELPTFSGDPREWSVFISNFEHSTAICGFSNEENLLRLQRCLKGKARDAVSSCLGHPATVPEAIDILTECYGRPELVIDTLMTRIRRMPAPRENSFESLVEYGLAVRNLCAAIGASRLHDYFNGGSLLNELVEKLPPNTRLNWFYHRRRHSGATLEAFNGWMKELVSAACLGVKPLGKDDRPASQHHSESHGRRDRDGARHATLNVHTANARRAEVCPACQGGCIGIDTCKKFGEMDAPARWELVKRKGICRTCLRRHRSPCRVEQRCASEGCGRKHHNLLHDDDYWAPKTATTSAEKTTECHTHSAESDSALLKYIPVTLYGNEKRINTMALLDDGSTSTFVEHALVEELGVSGKPRPLCIAWTGDQQRYEGNSMELPLKISGQQNDAKIFTMSAVHTLGKIKIRPQSVNPESLAARFKHLKGIPIHKYDNAQVRIIIGVDNSHLGHSLRTVEGEADQPAAARTRLGWTVYGPCNKHLDNGSSNASLNLHLCACSERDDAAGAALKGHFSLDSMGVYRAASNLRSVDEARALRILNTGVKLDNRRYEAGLLWKFNNISLPDSRAMANKRYHCLERKLQREPELAASMQEKIAEYEMKGYIRRLTTAETTVSHPNDWSLPIFPGVNPNKPAKIRIVFDAAARVNGVSKGFWTPKVFWTDSRTVISRPNSDHNARNGTKAPKLVGALVQQELQQAECAINCPIQREVYSEEISDISRQPVQHPWKQAVKNDSPLNHQIVLNEIRLKYHVPHLRATYNILRRRCQYCKVRSAKPVTPAMGNLPAQRLATFQRPFSYTGIDYFGPMLVAMGRRVEKRWGVIFTCLTMRGIHIEVAHSLTTDSRILAMRNFAARKGMPLEFISDRGTNIVGASRELREPLENIATSRLVEEFEGPKTKWTFNPPAAPHFGGVWERLVQSIKRVLATFDLPPHPTDESLRSRSIEVELIIKLRPLAEIPLDDDSDSPLTPNHFILGSSNGRKPPVILADSPSALRRFWKSSQLFADAFWRKWIAEYLPTLTRRTKWHQPAPPIKEGDLVLIADGNNRRNCWPRGRVIKVIRAADGQVRRATVLTSSGCVERPAVNLAVLDVGQREPSQCEQ